MYSIYSKCDPLLSGQIERRDQMVPLMAVEVLQFIPGFPGLFMSSIFAATLSSTSSGMNGLAANLLCDFVEPAYGRITQKELSETSRQYLSRVFGKHFLKCFWINAISNIALIYLTPPLYKQ